MIRVPASRGIETGALPDGKILSGSEKLKEETVKASMAAATGKAVWVGRVISVLSCLIFLFSALLKLKGGPELSKGLAHLGLPESMIVPLAIVEISCVVIYLIPATSVLGAILLTGYIGGAICTHWRVGDPFVVHMALGFLIWLGLYLRENRLKALLPRRSPAQIPGT